MPHMVSATPNWARKIAVQVDIKVDLVGGMRAVSGQKFQIPGERPIMTQSEWCGQLGI